MGKLYATVGVLVLAAAVGCSSADSTGGGQQAAGGASASGDGASGGVGGATGGGLSVGGNTSGGGGAAQACNDGDVQDCYSANPNTIDVGECVQGTHTCSNGVFGPCDGEVTPTVESCDGLDDDCNGAVDDLAPVTCGMGSCQVTVAACDNGQPNTCTPLTPSTTEACDGFDDDCDGQVDEGCSCTNSDTQICYTGPNNTQGVGECVSGTQTCSGGMWGACNGDALPGLETCDGFDNDCDGNIDEGCSCQDGNTQGCYSGPNGTQNVGECLSGTQTCTLGAWDPCSGDVAPQTELCDGLDEDCDGQIDQGNPEGGANCDSGQPGICQAGETTCVNAQLVCNQLQMAGTEICDGTDNDCDGQTDENNPGGGFACPSGQPGVCATGTTTCTSGSLVCAQNQQPTTEICDSLDNDCDGQTDENNPGGGQNCATGQLGVCAAGSTACTGGNIVCAPTTSASNEICDGLDNDCDGQADEGNPGGGGACNTGNQGLCAAGALVCTSGNLVCTQTNQPSSELCDGQDNDCDGQIDEGNPGGNLVCNTGQQGVCAPGNTACNSGSIQCNPNDQPSSEVCDGLDNDCDGQVDNGNPGGNLACPTGQQGVCAAGNTACIGGNILCQPSNVSGAELCDGLDNDCDGQVDNGNPGGNLACNTGQLGVCAAGATACSNGSIVCNANQTASAEVCDGLDNDCDGGVDDGNPGGNQACNTGQLGVCAAGTTQCSAGSVVCNGTNSPSAETCDGLDNDCNGGVDDGNPGGGAACNTGNPGICAAGTMTCTNGSVSCAQDNTPGGEICANSLDDDCDGQTDESDDADGDGWGLCDGDCCEAGMFCASNPELVNPGAFEVVGDGLDNDCDPGTSDIVPAAPCSTSSDFTAVTGTQVAQAMDLCQFTTANPPLPQRKWGVISADQRLANGANPNGGTLNNMQNWMTSVMANYGTNVSPRMNNTMAAISTGRARDTNDPGFVVPQVGTDFASSSVPPAVYLAAHAGNLPASASCNGNCPAGSGANDSINIRMQVRVPTNALSFSYKFKFYTAEFPEWTCTVFNDFYLALLQTGAPGIPADTNISFDTLNNPVSVNNGFFDVCAVSGCYTCPAGTNELVGTGMEGGVGGGTVWLVTTAPVVPGETIVLELMTFDVSDGVWDSTVLLDDFQWALTSTGVGTTPG